MLSNLNLDPTAIFCVALGTFIFLQWRRRKSMEAEAAEAKERAAKIARETPSAPKGDLTAAELAQYDGSDENKPVLISARGRIFDVTRGKDFYGKGGPYNKFAGKDASRALAKMSLEDDDVRNPDLSDLSASEIDTLDQWILKFEMKYTEIGKLVPEESKKSQ